MTTYYLITTNAAGYESAWCTNGEFVGVRHCRHPETFAIVRTPVIKTWKSRAGAQRWLNDRPGFKAEIVAR